MLNDKKVIFFDLFSTLVSLNDHNSHLLKASQYLSIDEKDWSRVSMSQYGDRGIGLVDRPFDIVSNIARTLRPELTDEEIDGAVAVRIKRFSHCVTNPEEEVVKVLEQLKQSGFRLGLISNADVIDIMGWPASPLSRLFDTALFSCEVGVAKPDKAIYELALTEMNVPATDCIFVGDGGSDELFGARALGMTTVLTTQYRWQNDDALERLKTDADHIIDHLKELRELFAIG